MGKGLAMRMNDKASWTIRTICVAVAAVALLTACGGSPSTEQSSQATPPEPPKPWEPIAYDPASQTLAVNDLAVFFNGFKENSDTQKKGEFETTADYEERINDLGTALGPFSPEALYALTPQQYFPFAYNADIQAFAPRSGTPHCWKLQFNHAHDGVECRFGDVVDVQRDFEGRNAFGTSARVNSAEGRQMYLLVSKQSKAHSKEDKSTSYKVLKGSCPVALEQARTISGGVDMAYLVRITGAEMAYAGYDIEDATVASPYEKQLERQDIPVDVVGAVCYKVSDLTILHTEMF